MLWPTAPPRAPLLGGRAPSRRVTPSAGDDVDNALSKVCSRGECVVCIIAPALLSSAFIGEGETQPGAGDPALLSLARVCIGNTRLARTWRKHAPQAARENGHGKVHGTGPAQPLQHTVGPVRTDEGDCGVASDNNGATTSGL